MSNLLVNELMAYENGHLSEWATLLLFSKLIRNDMAWTLQGHYGRMAQSLIEQKLIDFDGHIDKKRYELLVNEE